MELLTSSRLKSFRACPRQHFYAHVEGYRPAREAPAMAFGTAVHEALAAWWSTGPATAFECRSWRCARLGAKGPWLNCSHCLNDWDKNAWDSVRLV